MKQMQEKSPCCWGQVWRFGERRRQCSVCRKTWRAWSNKRGRKARRSNDAPLLKRYLSGQLSISGHAKRRDTPARGGIETRLRKARNDFIAVTSWPPTPPEPSILITDAFQQTINSVTRTGYLGFMRPLAGTKAVILPPYYQNGLETSDGWAAAFASYETLLDEVEALVCDGAIGLVRQAQARGWVLQRCHFHLLHSLNNYVRRGRLSRNQRADEIHELVRIVLQSPSDDRAYGAVCRLQLILPELLSRGAREVISGFIKHWLDYRAYIYYDQLNLPRTSNSAEQAICMVRRLQQTARGWSSHAAFADWAEAVLKHQQTITCLPSNISTKLI